MNKLGMVLILLLEGGGVGFEAQQNGYFVWARGQRRGE